MRRGLLKDLANTPTQIACGWRMYGDLSRLSANSGAEIVIDLLHGTETCDGAPVKPSLELGDMAVSWFRERLERDRVPPGRVGNSRPHADS